MESKKPLTAVLKNGDICIGDHKYTISQARSLYNSIGGALLMSYTKCLIKDYKKDRLVRVVP